jgi:hypothetical protein
LASNTFICSSLPQMNSSLASMLASLASMTTLSTGAVVGEVVRSEIGLEAILLPRFAGMNASHSSCFVYAAARRQLITMLTSTADEL